MKKHLIPVLTVLCIIVSPGLFAAGSADSPTELDNTAPAEFIVYAYDSFVSDWGPGPFVAEQFEAQYGIPVTLVSAGDSGQVLQRVILEKDNPNADIIIGIDNNLIYKALNEDILEAYESSRMKLIPSFLHMDENNFLTPFDYGYFSLIVNTEFSITVPQSLDDLEDAEYADSIIVMDPRTSSPGLGLLHWTVAQYGADFTDFWESIKPSLLTVTDGWDSGYGLFTAGEAPLVLSYTTSPAYHAEYETPGIYEAVIFDDGHYMQIEGAGIVKGTDNREEAEMFLDFLLSDAVQEHIPLTNWMYPVVSGIQLPESYNYAPKPDITLSLPAADIAENLEVRLESWTEVMVGR